METKLYMSLWQNYQTASFNFFFCIYIRIKNENITGLETRFGIKYLPIFRLKSPVFQSFA